MNEPKTREQYYLASIAGKEVSLPYPKTRTQEYLAKIAKRFSNEAPKIRKLRDYLYEIEFSDYDYNAARENYANHKASLGACSAVRKGNYYGRNFDWNYDDAAEFIVRTNKKGTHKSISVCTDAWLKELTKDGVESGIYFEAYAVLPFNAVDGINDAGVVCNANVVPTGDRGITTGTNPGKELIYTSMVVRYILDNADSAADAVEKLKGINIVRPEGHSELHWMILDETDTYVVECIDNKLVANKDKYIMTNFYITGFDGNTATAFYDSSNYDKDTTTLTPHADGIERYDILVDGIDGVSSVADMRELMDSVKYTKAYAETWYSELLGDNGYGDYTIDRPAEDFTVPYAYWQSLFTNRKRDGKTWQTVHSCVYDIPNKKMYIVNQEQDFEFVVPLEETISGDYKVVRLIVGDEVITDPEYTYLEAHDDMKNGVLNAVSFEKSGTHYMLFAQTDDGSEITYTNGTATVTLDADGWAVSI